jgi:peptidoglycan/LPS O-acetylase OafA/YrhL
MVLRSFYIRRFLRIFPIYYATLFLAFVVNIPAVRIELGWHLTYLSNWYFGFRGMFGDTTAHLWSLAVEEQFYVIWPWVVLLSPAAALRWSIGTMIVTGPVSRFVLGSAGVNGLAVWITTPTVLDALGLGCLLAYVWKETTSADQVARWAGLSGVCIVGLHTAMKLSGISEHVIFAISPLGWGLVCTWLVHRAARRVHGWIGKVLRAAPLVYVGTISYGVYLFHPFISTYVNEGGRRKFIAVMLISFAAAATSWRLFEQPINALKKHFPYLPAPQAPQVGSQQGEGSANVAG